MSWCILELSRRGYSTFKLFQSFSLNEGDWKLTNVHDVEEKAFNYIISDHHGNTELVYKGCEGATEQTEEAITEWKKKIEDLWPGETITCIPLAEFIARYKTEEKWIEPCSWRILKMTDEQGTATFKLFRAFRPYRREDWWLNSGITEIEETSESYVIDGVSGSQYEVAKTDEGDSPTLDTFIKEAREGFLEVGMMKSAIEISTIDECRKELKV